MTKDEELISEAVGVLEEVGCQFWACTGPTLRPVSMVTCCRCATLAKLQKRLGIYAKGQPDRVQLSDQIYRSYLDECNHRE